MFTNSHLRFGRLRRRPALKGSGDQASSQCSVWLSPLVRPSLSSLLSQSQTRGPEVWGSRKSPCLACSREFRFLEVFNQRLEFGRGRV